jgi:hypothetical protein
LKSLQHKHISHRLKGFTLAQLSALTHYAHIGLVGAVFVQAELAEITPESVPSRDVFFLAAGRTVSVSFRTARKSSAITV